MIKLRKSEEADIPKPPGWIPDAGGCLMQLTEYQYRPSD